MTVTAHDVAFDGPLARVLIDEVQQEYVSRYGGPDETPLTHGEFDLPGGAFLVITANRVPVGCGGLRRHDEGVAEIKRMYVRAPARGRGHGRRLLDLLERRARDLGYRAVVLETGTAQPEAMRLYASAGYTPIAPYGHHRCSPSSRCFAKDL